MIFCSTIYTYGLNGKFDRRVFINSDFIMFVEEVVHREQPSVAKVYMLGGHVEAVKDDEGKLILDWYNAKALSDRSQATLETMFQSPPSLPSSPPTNAHGNNQGGKKNQQQQAPALATA